MFSTLRNDIIWGGGNAKYHNVITIIIYMYQITTLYFINKYESAILIKSKKA
jgi:hypothetical protein